MKLSGLSLMGLKDMPMVYSNRMTMLSPYLGHIRGIFLEYICFEMPELADLFTEESDITNR